ncbi:MAG: hypothetical protein ACREFD_19355 [Stellaceae bacterium]
MDREEIEVWLERDEAQSRPYRADRLHRLTEILKIPENGMLFFGGRETYQAFTELRLAYVHGLFMTVVLLVLLLIERHLAGQLYVANIEAAKSMRMEDLIAEALKNNILTQNEGVLLNQLRLHRNAYTHFRPPMNRSSSLRRSIELPFDDLLESDAIACIQVLSDLVERRHI